MKILFVGKFFPIQGGEATKAYCLLKDLVSFGHQVIILTDTSSYSEESLCVRSFEDQDYLSDFLIFDKKNFSSSLYSCIVDICLLQEIDILVGWYLFPYALETIRAASFLGKPVVVQHAGSDIHCFLSFSESEKINCVSLLNKASCVLFYPNTESILKSLGVCSLVKHEPLMSRFYFKSFSKSCFDRFLVLGAKNSSKNYQRLKDFSLKNSIPIDWYGVGVCEDLDIFRSFQSIPPWKIPSLIQSYKGLIYSEESFDVETHRSRVPFESLASGRPVFIDLKTYYSFYQNIEGIFPFSFDDPQYLKNLSFSSVDFYKKYDDSFWAEFFEGLLMSFL